MYANKHIQIFVNIKYHHKKCSNAYDCLLDWLIYGLLLNGVSGSFFRLETYHRWNIRMTNRIKVTL